MKIDGNQIKVGNILEINSRLWRVLKTQHTQPGKGGAYLQVEMKEIREGKEKQDKVLEKAKKYLTKYEKTKILGLRAQQISTGSPVFTLVPEGMISPLDIAEKELKERKIPFILKRSVGNDKYEYWKLEDPASAFENPASYAAK